MLVSTASAIAGYLNPLRAQSVQAASQSKSTSIRLSLPQNSYVIGEKPVAVVAINNISPVELWVSDVSLRYRIHISSSNGEPAKSELYRHLLGDFRSGDGPAHHSGPVAGRSIAPGSVYSEKYDLSAFYDLNQAGDYSVYLEICDPAGPEEGSGHWLRTNTVKFVIKPPIS